MHIHVYTCMYLYIHVWTSLHMYIHAYTCVYMAAAAAAAATEKHGQTIRKVKEDRNKCKNFRQSAK